MTLNQENKDNKPSISKGRFAFGVFIFFLGFSSPLFIPLVTKTNWSVALKTTISGLLALGIPEVMIILAVAILGKEGYGHLKDNLLKFLHKISPDEISRTRYIIGIFMFTTPLVAGWSLPYLAYLFDPFKDFVVGVYIIGDIAFLSSFIILGGNFWDKFRALFIYK
jgi:hypothetical protein